MRPPLGKILTGAAVVFMMTTGTAYAVATVTSADIVDETIKSADIQNGSLQRVDIAPSARLPRAFVGTNADILSLPDTFTVVSSVSLPPGRWHVTAKNVVVGQYDITCRLRRGAAQLDGSTGWHSTSSQFVLPVETVITLNEKRTIYSECAGVSNAAQMVEWDLYAVEVAP